MAHAHEYSTRTQIQHKNTDTAEAPDSEKKAQYAAQSLEKPVGKFINRGGLITRFAISKFSRILHTSGQNARKMAPRCPLELSEGPPGVVFERRSSRDDERAC